MMFESTFTIVKEDPLMTERTRECLHLFTPVFFL